MEYSTKTNRRLSREERVCIIRTRDGVKMELRGADAPSVPTVLLFYKRRKLAAAKRANHISEDGAKQRMARDLNNRLAGRGGERSIPANHSRGVDRVPWWERIG